MENGLLKHSGLYSDPDVSRTFYELREALDHIAGLDTQGLHLPSVGEANRARAAEIVSKARTFERFVKAATVGR